MFRISIAILAFLNLYTLSLFSADFETQIAKALGAKYVAIFQGVAAVGFILPLSLLLLKLLIFKPKQEKPGPDNAPDGKTNAVKQTEEYVHEETTILTIKKITKTIRKKIKDIFVGRWPALLKWPSFKTGEVGNKRELDDFINLLNLNPDRYVPATVKQGDDPDSLSVVYDVYEANPWHFFVQVDNAGYSHNVDINKVSRITSTFRWIRANERFVPAKMTTFGGMYSVRGYNEYEL